jgi:ubiquinone/menaquinone biosynthesis C-methylase UbiE
MESIVKNSIKYHARSGYQGKTAARYDHKRSKRKKWKREMAALRTLTTQFEPGTSILDIPLGTGRFLEFYNEGKHTVYGIDISRDMLLLAKAKCSYSSANSSNNGGDSHMMMGEAEHIPMKDKSVDYVVCIRLLNWVTKPIFKEIIKEFLRVARKEIIIGFRCQQNMKFKDFLRFGIVSFIPTPHRLSRWVKTFGRFYAKVIGKLKSLAVGAAGTTKKKQTGDENQQQVFRGSTLYDPVETRAFFSKLGLEVKDSFPIDTLPAFFKRKIKPYSIYSLKPRE